MAIKFEAISALSGKITCELGSAEEAIKHAAQQKGDRFDDRIDCVLERQNVIAGVLGSLIDTLHEKGVLRTDDINAVFYDFDIRVKEG